MNKYAIVPFLFLSFLSLGQQKKLFFTEGFENCLPCNEKQNLSFCAGWEQTPASKVFIMSSCNEAMPYNAYGFQYPFEGNAYAALHVIDDARLVYNKEGGDRTTFRSRGYMRLILHNALMQNHKYKFSCNLSLGEGSAFSIGNLFVDISTRRLKQECSYTASLKADNAFKLTGGAAMRDTIRWNQVSTEFTAKGGERFITIGLFKGGLKFSDYKKLLKNAPNPKGNGCNYFIDNVEIKEL
ncbi:hypothetical protein [Hymenobacter siberiensis]|uniref:hypothetical protein n=2 Tax=Hymenobacter siberiensis TaxID=2848396 RepID=UPI001C1DF27E|nr:hypothetical protein [Hymenobacter siberiensis]MBU6123384.1 hypothetical protein [Hymenobacter siberiensis]